MGKKIIAVDLDDVLSLYAPAFVELNNSKWQMGITLDDVDENWAKMWGVNYQDMEVRAKVLQDELFINLDRIEEAKPVLNKLGGGYRLVVATSRRKILEEDTRDWIEKHYPGVFDDIHHAGIYDEVHTDHTYKKTKIDICQKIGADFLIDDQPKHCIAVSEVGIKSLLFGDYPWNKVEKLPDGVVRVRDWPDIARFFNV